MFLSLLFAESERSKIEVCRNVLIMSVRKCDGELSRYQYRNSAIVLKKLKIINQYNMWGTQYAIL